MLTSFICVVVLATTAEAEATSHVAARRLHGVVIDVPCCNLQNAYDGADPGDELVLADGTYTGSGDNVLEITKDITIRALNSGQVTLDGDIARRVIKIDSGTVIIEGLKITKGSLPWGYGGGIVIYGGTVALVSCEVYNNKAKSGGGGVYINGGDVTFNNVDIYNNEAADPNSGGGIYIASGILALASCELYSNTATYFGGGIFISGSSTEVAMTGCNFHSNDAIYGENIKVSSGTACSYPAINTGVDGPLDVCAAPPAITACGPNTNLNAGVCEIAWTACGANTNLNAGVCVIASTACGANTNLNVTTGACEVASTALTQLCLTDTAAPTVAPTAAPTVAPTTSPTAAPTGAPTTDAPIAAPTAAPTAALTPVGLHLAAPNAKLMFGPGANAPCTIELNAGKLVSSCHIDGACSGRRLLEVHDEHNAEVASLKAENEALKAKLETALKTK